MIRNNLYPPNQHKIKYNKSNSKHANKKSSLKYLILTTSSKLSTLKSHKWTLSIVSLMMTLSIISIKPLILLSTLLISKKIMFNTIFNLSTKSYKSHKESWKKSHLSKTQKVNLLNLFAIILQKTPTSSKASLSLKESITSSKRKDKTKRNKAKESWAHLPKDYLLWLLEKKIQYLMKTNSFHVYNNSVT